MIIRREGLKPLAAAIALASYGSTSIAASYELGFTGYWMDTVTVISNVPGVPTAPYSPLYQLPRLGNHQPPGWPVTMALSIDAASGAIVDFRYAMTGGGWLGHGGPQSLLYSDEVIFQPNAEYYQQFTNGSSFCSVTNPANDADGVLEYDCPVLSPIPSHEIARFSNLNHTGVVCITDRPSTLAPGANGCGAIWGGFPYGFSAAELANGAGQVVPANFSLGGVPLALTGLNPPLYRSVDHSQNSVGIDVVEFQGGRHGGIFRIEHTGTLADGDFQVTALQFEDVQWIEFVIPHLYPLPNAVSTNSFDFATVVSQQFVLDADEAKAVPVAGPGFMFTALLGLLSMAVRLLKKGGQHETN